jgi:hypothetical protein
MRNKFLPVHTLAMLLAGFVFGASAADQKHFTQDRFAIGLWCPPQTSARLADHYREIAAANFTLVIGTAGTNAAAQLKLCEKAGLQAIVDSSGPVEKLPDSPACWGYMVVDEPGAGSFPDLTKRAADIRAHRPGRFGYINLLPNYAPAWALGTKSYDEYVSQFIDIVKPEVLSMDHYPQMRPNSDTRDQYRANLETFRKHSLAAGIPFWNFFYCMPFGDRLDPTEAQIRWQINTSMAYGAKGVLYFCYWTPGKGAAGAGEFPKGGAIITAEGLPTRHYDEARRINAELKHLGPTLMKLTSTGIYYINLQTNSGDVLEGSPLRKLSAIRGDPPAKYLAGMFRQPDGGRAVILVNDSYSQTGWLTVEFDAPAESVREVSKTTGKAVPITDDSPELKGLQISLGAGDARLFLLPPRR